MIAVATAADIGGRRRFIAPLRDAVDAACFAQPIYDGLGDVQDLMLAPNWPTIASLDARLALPGKHLVEQDETLVADGLHYETRIAERGQIATRADNWHDLFNALIWARHPDIKRALNRQQCRHIAAMAPGQRNRAQAALTQFDESGVIVRVREPTLLRAWDRHDWAALFVDGAEQWHHGDIAVSAVIGHALLEQALVPERLLVGKCVVVQGDDDATAIAAVAQAIADAVLLNDPLELRPLPLAGIPGWHARQDAGFHARADYFRPLREGRAYPAALG